MSNAARKQRKRLSEPYIPPAEKVGTPILERRSLTSKGKAKEILNRGLEHAVLDLYAAQRERQAAEQADAR